MAAASRNVGSPPVQLEIVDVEKVKGLSNYYVYIIAVSCADGSTYHIYRRFRQFDEMQNALEKRFPIEAGSISHKDRTLPYLPGKKFLGRSAVRDVTDKRLPLLNSYLQTLYALPGNIRYDSIVSRFFTPSPDDLTRPAYIPSQARPNGITSSSAACIRPTRPAPPTSHRTNQRPPTRPQAQPSLKYIAIGPPDQHTSPLNLADVPLACHSHLDLHYHKLQRTQAKASDELSFNEGDNLSLLEQVDNGQWWKVGLRGKTGLAPANYIKVVSRPVVPDFKDSVQSSDEWDSSDGEGEGESGKGLITYYYNDAARTVEVDASIVRRPTYVQLFRVIQKQLHTQKAVLNYKDSDGDLVQLCGQQDMQLLSCEAMPPDTPTKRQAGKESRAPWAIYVTRQGDNTVYNTRPPRPPHNIRPPRPH